MRSENNRKTAKSLANNKFHIPRLYFIQKVIIKKILLDIQLQLKNELHRVLFRSREKATIRKYRSSVHYICTVKEVIKSKNGLVSSTSHIV